MGALSKPPGAVAGGGWVSGEASSQLGLEPAPISVLRPVPPHPRGSLVSAARRGPVCFGAHGDEVGGGWGWEAESGGSLLA